MTIVTFRTEGFNDGVRVADLLKAASLHTYVIKEWKVNDPINPNWEMDYYTLSCPDNIAVEEIRIRLMNLIENDSRFTDMHRCYQTLNEGDEPNEKYY